MGVSVQTAINIKPTCDIVEYASIRFTLFCLKAKIFPTVIVAADNTASKNGHDTFNKGEVPNKIPSSVNSTLKTLNSRAKPAALGATDKNAVTIVGEPS